LRSSRLTAAYNSYASFAGSSRALHLDLFDQPVCVEFCWFTVFGAGGFGSARGTNPAPVLR